MNTWYLSSLTHSHQSFSLQAINTRSSRMRLLWAIIDRIKHLISSQHHFECRPFLVSSSFIPSPSNRICVCPVTTTTPIKAPVTSSGQVCELWMRQDVDGRIVRVAGLDGLVGTRVPLRISPVMRHFGCFCQLFICFRNVLRCSKQPMAVGHRDTQSIRSICGKPQKRMVCVCVCVQITIKWSLCCLGLYHCLQYVVRLGLFDL